MQPIAIIVTSILLMVAIGSEGRIIPRCQLARMLYRNYKFPKSSLGDWVCLIEAESGRNTRAVSKVSSSGNRDYGMFQINSLYWCSGGTGSKYNECKVSCSALANDNITDDVKCARKIYGRHGYNAWYGWINKCKGKNVKSYIANCTL